MASRLMCSITSHMNVWLSVASLTSEHIAVGNCCKVFHVPTSAYTIKHTWTEQTSEWMKHKKKIICQQPVCSSKMHFACFFFCFPHYTFNIFLPFAMVPMCSVYGPAYICSLQYLNSIRNFYSFLCHIVGICTISRSIASRLGRCISSALFFRHKTHFPSFSRLILCVFDT